MTRQKLNPTYVKHKRHGLKNTIRTGTCVRMLVNAGGAWAGTGARTGGSHRGDVFGQAGRQVGRLLIGTTPKVQKTVSIGTAPKVQKTVSIGTAPNPGTHLTLIWNSSDTHLELISDKG